MSAKAAISLARRIARKADGGGVDVNTFDQRFFFPNTGSTGGFDKYDDTPTDQAIADEHDRGKWFYGPNPAGLVDEPDMPPDAHISLGEPITAEQSFADGGEVEEGESWSPDDTPLPTPDPRKAPTVDTGQSLTEYHPSWTEKAASAMAGDAPLGSPRSEMTRKLMGTTGVGQRDIAPVDFVPGVGQVLGAQEGIHEGNYQQAAMAVLPGAAKTGKWAVKGAEHAAYDLAPEIIPHLKQTGPQAGSNPGGLYTSPGGKELYLKTPQSVDHALNEKLAAELYKEAGVPTADVRLTEMNGQPTIASPIIKGTRLDKFANGLGDEAMGQLRSHIGEHFPADAWLGNYDAVGTGFDNIVVDNKGIAHRIDMGGALRYRAQGKPKTDFGPEVKELNTMLDPSINPYSSAIFHGHQPSPDSKTAQKIASMSDDKIRQIVGKWGPVDEAERNKLADTLIARRDNLAEAYGIKKPGEGSGGDGYGFQVNEHSLKHLSKMPKEMQDWHKSLGAVAQKHGYKEVGAALMPEGKNADFKSPNYGGLVHKMYVNEHGDRLHMYPHYDMDHGTEAAYKFAYIDRSSLQAHSNPNATAKNLDDFLKWKKSASLYPDNFKPDWNNPDHVKLVKQEQAMLHSYLHHQQMLASIHEGAPAAKSMALRPVNEQVKLMNLKKTNSLDQFVHSLKGYNYEEIPAGPKITSKQKQNIIKHFSAYPPDQIASAIKGMPEDMQKNITSWLDMSTAAKVQNALEGEIKPTKIYPPNELPADADLQTVFNSIKGMHPLDDKISYQAYTNVLQTIKEAPPSKLKEIVQNLPLVHQQKAKSWIGQAGAGKLYDVEGMLNADAKKSEAKSFAKEFAEHLEPMSKNEWMNYKPERSRSARNLLPADKINFISGLGFNPDLQLFHAGRKPKGLPWSEQYKVPQQMVQPSDKSKAGAIYHDEKGFFTAHDLGMAKGYEEPRYEIGSSKIGKKFVWGSFLASPKKPMVADWKAVTGDNSYSSFYMKHLIQAAHDKGADLLVVKNIADVHRNAEHAVNTQYVVLDTSILRSPHAKFNPSELHLPKPLAGIAGAGVVGYGASQGRGKEDGMKRGGGVDPVRQTIRKALGGQMGMNERAFIPKPPRLGQLGRQNMPHQGMIHSVVPGRTDKLPMKVRGGSYVLPADIVSGVGQGNSMAGANAFNKLLKMGPYGAAINKVQQPNQPRLNSLKGGALNAPRAKEGGTPGHGEEHIPIIAAGGEFVVPPEKVLEIGGGDMKKGHDILDALVLHLRQKHIKETRKLKGPKRN